MKKIQNISLLALSVIVLLFSCKDNGKKKGTYTGSRSGCWYYFL